MKKSTAFKIIGIIVLIGSFWYGAPYSKYINNLAIQSAEQEMVSNAVEPINNLNASSFERKTITSTKAIHSNTNVRDAKQHRQQMNSMIAEHGREAFKDLGVLLWDIILKPILFLAFCLSIPIWLFQTIRRNLKNRKLSQRTKESLL
jgi:hypothetical protein